MADKLNSRVTQLPGDVQVGVKVEGRTSQPVYRHSPEQRALMASHGTSGTARAEVYSDASGTGDETLMGPRGLPVYFEIDTLEIDLSKFGRFAR